MHYNNYRILLVDDASIDDTIEKAKKLVITEHKSFDIEIIAFQKPQGKLRAMHTVLNACKDEEIIVLLDARDWLADASVLSTLHKEYTENDIWLTFGTATSDPKSCNIGLRNGEIPNEIIENRHFRKIFTYMPVRTFYAWLFKLIKKEDLINPATGDYYQEAAECYIMWPLLEMAHTHFKAISEITYVVNCNDPITKLIEDYHLRMACNAQMGKNIPIYPIASKPNHLNGAV